MGAIARLRNWVSKGLEGSFRGPVTGYSHWGNPFPVSFGDGFQDGLTLSNVSAQNVPTVYACVMVTAKAVSICMPNHIVVSDSKKRTTSNTSPASRIFRRPNQYYTWPQFALNSVAQMLFDGEAFILCLRDERFAIKELHLMPRYSCMPYVEPASGEIFYSIGSNPMLPAGTQYMAPARDIIHLRQYCPRHPLIGESPITAAMLALGINVALSRNQAAFYNQMSRPSGILSTDTVLTKDQMMQLRSAFEEQSKGMNAGRIPVLAGGLKFNPLSISSQDSQMVESQRMSIEEISRVFGVPLPVIGDLSHATMANVESTVNFWLSTGLGSVIDNFEKSLQIAFNLPSTEYVELDVTSLLRMDFQARVEGLTKGIQGGLITPNEARDKEGLEPKEGGDDLFMQRQMTSVNLLAELGQAELDASNAPATGPVPATETAPEPVPTEPKSDPQVSRALVVDMMTRKRIAA